MFNNTNVNTRLMKLRYLIPVLILTFLFGKPAMCAEQSSLETFSENASGVKKVRLENITYTDISYYGVENAVAFTIKFKRKAEAHDSEEFKEIVSGLDLNVSRTGEILVLRLFAPQTHSYTVFKVLFQNKDWRAGIEITGPKDIDIDMKAEFSDVRTYGTDGDIKIDSRFSKVYCYNHSGHLNGKFSYGELNSDRFNGSFNLELNTGNYILEVDNLTGNSTAKIGMGNFKLGLPKNLGAEIIAEKTLGNINLPKNGNILEKDNRIVLNNGGFKIALDASMGKITVDNSLPPQTMIAQKPKISQPELRDQPSTTSPLPKKPTVTKPKVILPPEPKVTIPPVERIPKQAEVIPDTSTSAVEKAETPDNEAVTPEKPEISETDSLKELEQPADIAAQTVEEFTEGSINSIRIKGISLLTEEEIFDNLTIKKGDYVTKEQLDSAVSELKDKEKLIESASYSIDTDGNLTIRIREINPFKHDFDIYGSFSRVAGLGLGPKLTINSMFGPISKIEGGARYNWGNREWTYNLDANKYFFNENRLTFGGTYRQDYESNTDWAIPEQDAALNAAILGLEAYNLYQVESSSGYISQSLGKILTVKAEYFDEDFSSVKKHTNASIFNNAHKKEDNPPLDPLSEGKIKGMRYSLKIATDSRLANTLLYLEAETTDGKRPETLPSYTRYIANIVSNTRLTRRQTFKFRVAGGYSKDALPDQKSFRLGGLNTLRGFEPGSVPPLPEGMTGFDYQGGGNRMFLMNLDYIAGGRKDDMKFILFGDLGGVWRKNVPVTTEFLRRDIGVGLAFDNDFFTPVNTIGKHIFPEDSVDAFRINCAVPVGNVSHKAVWTVNFVRAY